MQNLLFSPAIILKCWQAALSLVQMKVWLEMRGQDYILVASLVAGYFLSRRALVKLGRARMRRDQELQQRMLRSQMSPHFLYNALSNLMGFIRSKKNDEAIEFADKFSQVAKLSLLNAQQNAVTLKSELTALEQYLQLQEIFLAGKMDYEIVIAEGVSVDNIQISPMLLQPFIENAVLHGFRGIAYKGQISIRIWKVQAVLVCEIEDNGRGLRGAEQPSKPSLSTAITESRLRLLEGQGKKSRLQITEKTGADGTGVIVRLEIPYMELPAE